MPGGGIRRDDVATAVRHVSGLVELGSHFGSEVATLLHELHAALVPKPLWTVRAPGSALYGSLHVTFRGATQAAAWGGRLVLAEPRSDAWLDVQSALNGAYGHLFAARNSAFALPMSLHREASDAGSRRLFVFLHGLSMNERGWRNSANARFRDWARCHLGAEAAYLRYNTGLRISTNGRALAELLESETTDVSELLLVGHSMGGLVARSALHQAEERGLAWARKVTHLVCVGSPHEGTSLERVGNQVNRMLGLTPWTRPFMRLGNLRSDGIRDLRFGHLLEEDWKHRHIDDPTPSYSRVPLASHVDHLHIAGARCPTGRFDRIGDWLVPLESALAANLHCRQAARRELVRGVGHIAMLAHDEVYERLKGWLRESPQRSPSAARPSHTTSRSATTVSTPR